MKAASGKFLDKAIRSVRASERLLDSGDAEFAASRAYYAMFYVAEALLSERGLRFRKHGGVHAAFGEHFAKSGELDPKYHRCALLPSFPTHPPDCAAGPERPAPLIRGDAASTLGACPPDRPALPPRTRVPDPAAARSLTAASSALYLGPTKRKSPSMGLLGLPRARRQRLFIFPVLLLYGAGLRLLECCRLRVKDVDFATNQIVIRDGKGQKDRVRRCSRLQSGLS